MPSIWHVLIGTALLTLLPEAEMMTMVEQLMDDEALLAELDLPYLRRLRTASHVEGYAAGYAEGLREGEAAMLLQLVQSRFGPLPAEVTARVTAADADMLLRWSAQVLSALTLAAVFVG